MYFVELAHRFSEHSFVINMEIPNVTGSNHIAIHNYQVKFRFHSLPCKVVFCVINTYPSIAPGGGGYDGGSAGYTTREPTAGQFPLLITGLEISFAGLSAFN